MSLKPRHIISMTVTSLRSALQNLPETSAEAVIEQHFATQLLESLGFQKQEVYPQYPDGNGRFIDRAARKTVEDDVFLYTKSNPYLLVELKGREVNLSADAAQYQKAVNQLKQYLLAPNCKTVEWGIITNSCHIQLFRKHGKVIFPATQCLSINEDNVDKVAALIREKIEKPAKALTVAIYNNKGGVGKTTTTVNLAAILTLFRKKILVIDFDPNQQDLTSSLGLPLGGDNVFQALTERRVELEGAIHRYTVPTRTENEELRFDVVPADRKLAEEDESLLRNYLKWNTLHRKLEPLRQQYDYILIDAPPNWRMFSQLAVYAADVVLIPTKHNNLFSLENAAKAIKQFIPEAQAEKTDGSPVALPIFFNGEKITPFQLEVAQQEIVSILKAAKKEGFNLSPYFFPRATNARKDLHIHQIPSYANIASAAFSRIPAVYRDRSARDYYTNLAKEYFLQ